MTKASRIIEKGEYYTVEAGIFKVEALPGEPFHEALLKQSLDLKVACRNGVCGICEARVVSGKFKDGVSGATVRAGDSVYLCRASVLENAVIETTKIKKLGEIPLKELVCQVTEITPLSDDVFKVVLLTPAGSVAEFNPGQYLSINIPDAEPAFFSIASLPGKREVELHVQASASRESAMNVITFLKKATTVKVTLPYGAACLSSLPAGPVILLAAGTGYAQIKSILDGLIEKGFSQEIYVFWGGRKQKELYQLEEARAYADRHSFVSVTPVFGDVADNAWTGHHDQLVDAIKKQHPDLSPFTVYASGSPSMVYTALDAFLVLGLNRENFYSDVFEYAPRD